MIRFHSRIEGLEKVIKKIDAYDKSLSTGISLALDEGAALAASTARVTAPTGKRGLLKASIGSSSLGKYDKQFYALAPYSAYVEFGTGSRVFEAKSGFMFTPEMKEFASEFYVNGRGRMPASPFMFPALELAKKEIIKNIKKILLGPVRI